MIPSAAVAAASRGMMQRTASRLPKSSSWKGLSSLPGKGGGLASASSVLSKSRTWFTAPFSVHNGGGCMVPGSSAALHRGRIGVGIVIGCGGWADGARMFHVSGGPLRTKRGNNDEHEEDEEEGVVGGVEGASVNADDMVRNSSQSSALVQRDSNWVPEEVIVIPVFRRPVFPGIATPIALTNPAFCEAILKLKDNSGTYPLVGIFMTKNPTREEGSPITSTDELHQIGCLGQVVYIHGVQQLGVQLLVAGAGRILITGTVRKEPFLSVSIAKVHDKKVDPQDKNIKAWVLEIISTMKSVVKLEHSFKEQLQTALTQVDVNNPGLLADITASMTTADRDSLQNVLDTLDVQDRLAMSLRLLKIELEQAELQRSIHKQMEDSVSKMQRKHFLTEQLRIIKKELGLERDDKDELVQAMTKKLAELNAPPAVEKVITEQLKKISMLEPSSPEFNITRTYLDWLVSIPWGISTEENFDVEHAKGVLDKDHYGMKDVKDRILEFIAVGKLKGTVQGRIICFVGPPGVGKTSIGKSIAASLNRKFYRFSVGGMTDVAEIKGHRRTYVGAMPGKAVQALKGVGSNNPVIVLDEIDKLGRGYQGDPASAMLELLDPAQNGEFLDHYLDVPINLSQVLFICTANSLDTIPGPLKDRMEIIQVSGYTADDKLHIAKTHLLPTARDETGIKKSQIVISDTALKTLISKYCREPGVRNLQKQMEKLLRKAAYLFATEQKTKLNVSDSNLVELVGQPKFPTDKIYENAPPGVVMGLAWTSMGGTSLYIESAIIGVTEKGGIVKTTGQMGDVMKESASIALSVCKRICRDLKLSNGAAVKGKKSKKGDAVVAADLDFFEKHNVHVHIPEGATPKDGPSAGVTMITSLLSLSFNQPVIPDLAMTGEVTLTGKVLPVGGIKEKVLAAQRAGVKSIILPEQNRRDWGELDDKTREGLEITFADHYADVFDVAFPDMAKKLSKFSSEIRSGKRQTRVKRESRRKDTAGGVPPSGPANEI